MPHEPNLDVEHSPIGGSIAKRILACPWSLANHHMVPPSDVSSPAAAEGTALHALLEFYYTGKLDTIEEAVGLTIEGVTLTEEQVDRALDAARAFDAYCDQLEEELGHSCEVQFERRVDFGDVIPGAFGTCDILLRCGYVMAALDWKFGRHLVSAEENAQLMFYGQAARRTVPEFQDCTHVELAIIQPANEASICTVWRTLPERLEKFEADLKLAVLEAQSDYPRCETGDHCQWCPLEAQCPQKRELAKRALLANVDNLDITQLVYWMDHADELASFISSVRDQALKLLEVNVKVPGYKLVERRANRSWVDPASAVAFAKENGFSEDDIFSRSLLSPAQFEKQLKLKDLPDNLVQKKSAGTTVAPMSDRRKDLNENDLQALKKIAGK